jgi:hypothetical protein
MTPQALAKQLLEDDVDDPSGFVDDILRDMEAQSLTSTSLAFKQLWQLGYRPSPPWSQSDIEGDLIAVKEVKVSYDHRTHVICYEPSTRYDFMVVIRTLSGDELRYDGGVIELPKTAGHFAQIVNEIEQCLTGSEDAVSAERAMRQAFVSARQH